MNDRLKPAQASPIGGRESAARSAPVIDTDVHVNSCPLALGRLPYSTTAAASW